MGASTPKAQPLPAKRPERIVDVEPEDIELGTEDFEEGTDLSKQGKRSLVKPSGAGSTAGVKV